MNEPVATKKAKDQENSRRTVRGTGWETQCGEQMNTQHAVMLLHPSESPLTNPVKTMMALIIVIKNTKYLGMMREKAWDFCGERLESSNDIKECAGLRVEHLAHI